MTSAPSALYRSSKRALFLLVLGCSAEPDPAGPVQLGAIAAPEGRPAPGSLASGGAPAPPPGVFLEAAGGEEPAPVLPGSAAADCDNILDVTYRDFNETHVDFEMEFGGDDARKGLLKPQLDPSRKPEFLDTTGCGMHRDNLTACAWNPTGAVITSADSFYQWYHTVEGVNIEFQRQMVLEETAPGTGIFVFDSDSFFPLTPEEGFGVTPKGNGGGRNFLFTTEIHLSFTYEAGQRFTFRGDDDLWIFINNQIALELGGMHLPWEGTIDFDAQAVQLGITPGGVYRMDVFQAERHTSQSNFRIETNIGCFSPAPIPIVQ